MCPPAQVLGVIATTIMVYYCERSVWPPYEAVFHGSDVIDAVDFVVGDAAQGVGQLGLRVAVLAKTTQAATAMGAIVVANRQLDVHTRDVIWDRAALGFGLWFFISKTQLCRHLGDSNLAGLQGQLKLCDALG